ncbi:DinB family protein [Sinomicrobium sp. M5D2P17]
MKNIIETQYELVKESREILLKYCTGISKKDFTKENSSFGKGSIRNLLVHTGNTYELWIGKHALQKVKVPTPYTSVATVDELQLFYKDIDMLMEEFLNRHIPDFNRDISICINGKTRSISALQLFTHVITHEFHHKGQVLSLSRHLGYVPVDTDIIR